MATGRPTKLDSRTQEKICVAIRRGLGYEQSARLAGISYEAFNGWRKRGEAELARLEQPGTRPSKREAIFVQFLHALQKAEDEGELTNANILDQAAKGGYEVVEKKVTRVRDDTGQMVVTEEQTTTKIAGPDWRAALAVLERRHPQRWVRQQRVEASGPDGGAIPVTMVEVIRPAVSVVAGGDPDTDTDGGDDE